MNKHAEADMLWHPLIQIVLVVGFVLIAVMGFYAAVGRSTYYEKNYLARDIGLTTEAILASPDPVIYAYPENTFGLTVKTHDSKIEILEQKEREGSPFASVARYNFIGHKDILVEDAYLTPFFDVIKDTEKDRIPIRLMIKKEGTILTLANIVEEDLG